MAENPYVNKVEYAGQTLMDLTGDTVTPSDVLNGTTFHDRSGAPQTGNLITHNVYDGLDSTSTSDALSANQGKILNDKINKYQGTRNWVSGVDCNNYTNEGIYSLSDNLTNAPLNVTYFTLIVYAPRNDAIIQMVIKDDSIFYRMKVLSGWASWKQFAIKGETGTITGITMNGSSKGTSGVIDLGTVNTSKVKNDLTETSSGYVLDARQGKVLNESKASVSLSSTLQSVNLLGQQAGVYRYGLNCTNIPSSENGYCTIIERDNTTKLAIAITASGRYFTNTMASGTWGGWVELALSDTVSKIAGLKSGTNNIGNILCAGYNTGSGNYADFFVPINTNGKNVVSASISSNSLVFLSSKRVTFSSAPSITVEGYTDYGVRLELRYPSTETANICATVYAVDLSIVCS